MVISIASGCSLAIRLMTLSVIGIHFSYSYSTVAAAPEKEEIVEIVEKKNGKLR